MVTTIVFGLETAAVSLMGQNSSAYVARRSGLQISTLSELKNIILDALKNLQTHLLAEIWIFYLSQKKANVSDFSESETALCSGYLRKETAVVSLVLPFIYLGLSHFVVHLKNSHRKKEKILRWIAKKRKKFLDGQWSEWTHGKQKVE